MAAYGVLIGGGNVMLVENPEDGKPIVFSSEPENVDLRYKTTSTFVDTGSEILQVWDIVPAEGTETDSAVALAKILAVDLDDDVALQVPALYPEWISGYTYEKGDRVRYRGELYKVIQGHTSQADWTPVTAPSLFAKILPGQEGSGTEIGEWVQPGSTNGYANGDKVTYNGHLWQSTANDNVWKPGDVGAPWTDLGEYSPEA